MVSHEIPPGSFVTHAQAVVNNKFYYYIIVQDES